MKIAVFHNLPSGGAKRALYGNIKFLAQNHEVDVFVPSTANEDYLPLKNVVNDLKVFEVKNTIPGFIYSSFKYFPSKVSLSSLKKTQKIIAEDINQKEYDVVLSEQDRYTMAPFILKYIEKPLVYYCQQPNCFRYKISKELYKKAGLEFKNINHGLYLRLFGSKMVSHDIEYTKYSNYVLVNSNFSQEMINKYYDVKSQVSYLGVDNTLFKPVDVSKQNFVLSVGQCIPEKGFEFILNSLARINEDSRPEFILVTDQGNLHWKNYLLKLADELKVKLKILHLLSDQELVLLYNKAKIVVYTPYQEPFGLVPLEAMSCGTPVVGVKEGGVMETVVNDKTGILTIRNESIFANAIEELLKNQDQIDRMSEESVEVANSFWTLENSAKRLLNHLNCSIDNYTSN
jgi:glycosyltransferase involved in cell wall biosynthesis